MSRKWFVICVFTMFTLWVIGAVYMASKDVSGGRVKISQDHGNGQLVITADAASMSISTDRIGTSGDSPSSMLIHDTMFNLEVLSNGKSAVFVSIVGPEKKSVKVRADYQRSGHETITVEKVVALDKNGEGNVAVYVTQRTSQVRIE